MAARMSAAQRVRVCLKCNSTDCPHIQKRCAPILAPRECELVRAAAGPDTHKELAEKMGITEGSVKVMLNRIYLRFGWAGAGSRRQLMLWAIEHKELLG